MVISPSLTLSFGFLMALAVVPAAAQTSTSPATGTAAGRPSGGPPHHRQLTTEQMQSIKACAAKAGITLPDPPPGPPPGQGQQGQTGQQGGQPPQNGQAQQGQSGPQGGPPPGGPQGMPQLTDAQRQALDACFAAAGASK